MAGDRAKELQNIGLASLGGTLEYFDFQVYVFVAAALGAELFPPGDSMWKTQVQTFGIFAIGYLVRPIAGMIIAHYADRIGRKKLFVFTVLLMSGPTCLMGLLPTYAQVGWLAPAGLLLLRILQGCAVGGELPGAAVFICEHATPRRLGLASGLFIGMVNSGLLLGAAAAFAAKGIAGLDPTWASLTWRLPFIVGGLSGLIAAYLRRHLAESPLFEETRAANELSVAAPIATVLRDYRRQCAFALTLLFVFSTTPAIYFQWLPTYLIGIRHVPTDWVFLANLCGVAAFVVSMPSWGMRREKISWPRLLVIAGFLNAGSAAWFFTYLPTLATSEIQLTLGVMLVGALCGVVHSVVPGLLCALFPTPIRQSGFAFPYSVGTALFSGLTPLVVATLVRSYGLATPMSQELLAGALALILSGWLKLLPLHLGNRTEPEAAAARPTPAASTR